MTVQRPDRDTCLGWCGEKGQTPLQKGQTSLQKDFSGKDGEREDRHVLGRSEWENGGVKGQKEWSCASKGWAVHLPGRALCVTSAVCPGVTSAVCPGLSLNPFLAIFLGERLCPVCRGLWGRVSVTWPCVHGVSDRRLSWLLEEPEGPGQLPERPGDLGVN